METLFLNDLKHIFGISELNVIRWPMNVRAGWY